MNKVEYKSSVQVPEGNGVALIDMRGALRLTRNPLISRCREEHLSPVFIYPLELSYRYIQGISSTRKEYLYGCIKEVKEELLSRGSDLILIDRDFDIFLDRCITTYKDLCVIHGVTLRDSPFITKVDIKGIRRIAVSEVITCTSGIKSIKGDIKLAMKSFSTYKNRDFIISGFKDMDTYDSLPLIQQIPLNPPFDFLNDMSKSHYYGGRKKGLDVMNQWIREEIQYYEPSSIHITPSSKLGPYLKYGSISRQELFIDIRSTDNKLLEGNYKLCEMMLLNEYILRSSKNKGLLRKRLSLSEMEVVKTWLKGETKYPLANAAMKQLRKTGYIQHSLREVLVRVAYEMGIDKWVIIDTLCYLLTDSNEIITTYYLNQVIKNDNLDRLHLLMEMERKDYVAQWNSSGIKLETLNLNYQ